MHKVEASTSLEGGGRPFAALVQRPAVCATTTHEGVIMAVQIVALVGSLRAGSHNRQLAEAAAKLVPEGVELHIHEDLENVPFYNEDIDLEGRVPQQAAALRASVE